MEEQGLPQGENTWTKKLWFGFFILMYPILITFSLVYTGLLLIFSTLSRGISFLANYASRRRQKTLEKPEGLNDAPAQ